jgi:hypothetical protein
MLVYWPTCGGTFSEPLTVRGKARRLTGVRHELRATPCPDAFGGL